MDLSSLSNATTSATALSNLILVSPQKTVGYQPQLAPSWANSVGTPPGTLLFQYEGEQSVSLASDITDHWIENNTTIQDQIALKPVTYTTHGFIGELTDAAPIGLQTAKLLAQKLVTIGSYLPEISATALLAYNEAAQLYQVGVNAKNAAVSAWQVASGKGGESVITSNGLLAQTNQTKQQQQFQLFYGYFYNRTLFTIQTPWAIFKDMAILSFRAVQEESNNVITDFEITFKQLRFATTLVSRAQNSTQNPDAQGRAATQGAGEVDRGTSTPPVAPLSFTDAIAGGR